jgi:tyrosinase
MQDIALRAPADQVDRYKTAADSFRMPYWDWARGEVGGGVPEFFVQPSITVTTPNDTEETLSNPLYAYDFRPLVPGDFTGKVCVAQIP